MATFPDRVLAADFAFETVPAMHERVVHNGRPWRVSGWWRLVKVEFDLSDPVSAIIAEVVQEDPASVSHKLCPCARSEATAVSLTGICGGFARIGDVVRTGDIATSHRFAAEAEASWMARRVNGHGDIGSGYRDLLERLYPTVDFSFAKAKA